MEKVHSHVRNVARAYLALAKGELLRFVWRVRAGKEQTIERPVSNGGSQALWGATFDHQRDWH